MRKLAVLVFLISFSFLFATEGKRSFQLIPQPQSIDYLNTRGIDGASLQYVVFEDSIISVLPEILDRLPQYRKNTPGIELKISSFETPNNPEGYTLKVTNDGAVIKSRTTAGLFYGCQTLAQLMEDSRDFNIDIPAMYITDYPNISYRAIHLDTKHHLDRIEYYYQMMDKLARYKINAVIWEIEDKLRFTRRPEIGALNAISKQEVQALCRYANERYIDISPLVQGLGHAAFILKHHLDLRENPQSDWGFCPAESQTYELQFDLYDDAIEAMPYGKYLHVGGDEVTGIGRDKRCLATKKSPFELQMMWLEKVCNYAIKNQRIPIFWDDMPLKYAEVWDLIMSDIPQEKLQNKWNSSKLDEVVKLFPNNCVFMRWNYNDATLPAHRMIMDWYTQKNLKVMGATAASAGDSPFLPRAGKINNIRGFSRLIADNKMLGILATAWDDGSPHLETVWRGYIALGEFAWNPFAKNVENFKCAYVQREFGLDPQTNNLLFLEKLEEAVAFFDHALITSGTRNPAWGVREFTLIELPDKSNHGLWSEKYQDKVNKALIGQNLWESIKNEINKVKKYALRNRYTLEVYEQTNNLINYPSLLLLNLHRYDIAKNTEERKQALKDVESVVSYFYKMRRELESIYGKTRFMENPEGYHLDMNLHNHLAAKTNNSDWLYLYELPMIEKVKMWLYDNKSINN